jgi:hypothetical protein
MPSVERTPHGAPPYATIHHQSTFSTAKWASKKVVDRTYSCVIHGPQSAAGNATELMFDILQGMTAVCGTRYQDRTDPNVASRR